MEVWREGEGAGPNQRSLVCLIKNLGFGHLRNRVPPESFKQRKGTFSETLLYLENKAWIGGSRK